MKWETPERMSRPAAPDILKTIATFMAEIITYPLHESQPCISNAPEPIRMRMHCQWVMCVWIIYFAIIACLWIKKLATTVDVEVEVLV